MPKFREDAWTGRWVAAKLEEHKKFTAVSAISSNRVRILRTIGDEHEVATMSLPRVNESDLLDILTLEAGVSFVVNIPRDAYYEGKTLELAKNKKIVLGYLGDLFRAMELEQPRTYVNPEVKFILRGLEQHSRVSSVRRLDDRRYRMERLGLSSVIVLALHDYDLSADSIRNAIDKYGHCDAILAANPNCRLTTLAYEVVENSGVQVYKWGELLKALNRPWS